jgi:hypothetical protein
MPLDLATAAPDARQALQGLLTGDTMIDRGLIEAFQRGYQRGRDDEAQASKAKLPKQPAK